MAERLPIGERLMPGDELGSAIDRYFLDVQAEPVNRGREQWMWLAADDDRGLPGPFPEFVWASRPNPDLIAPSNIVPRIQTRELILDGVFRERVYEGVQGYIGMTTCVVRQFPQGQVVLLDDETAGVPHILGRADSWHFVNWARRVTPMSPPLFGTQFGTLKV
jgi:hypothetical protein